MQDIKKQLINIEHYRGADFDYVVRFLTSNKKPEKLTGTIFFTVKKKNDPTIADDSDAIVKQDYVVSNESYKEISVSHTVLAAILGEYQFDISFKSDDDDNIYPMVVGTITFIDRSTNRVSSS